MASVLNLMRRRRSFRGKVGGLSGDAIGSRVERLACSPAKRSALANRTQDLTVSSIHRMVNGLAIGASAVLIQVVLVRV